MKEMIGERLKALRVGVRLSQTKLAGYSAHSSPVSTDTSRPSRPRAGDVCEVR